MSRFHFTDPWCDAAPLTASCFLFLVQGSQDASQQHAQPEKVGWIRKFCGKGIFREIWKNRFVVLRGDQLFICEKEVSQRGAGPTGDSDLPLSQLIDLFPISSWDLVNYHHDNKRQECVWCHHCSLTSLISNENDHQKTHYTFFSVLLFWFWLETDSSSSMFYSFVLLESNFSVSCCRHTESSGFTVVAHSTERPHRTIICCRTLIELLSAAERSDRTL